LRITKDVDLIIKVDNRLLYLCAILSGH
jgi:hypothetical protein